MKKRNGFTLVELLAVIVILAIILVIAIPQIMKTIDAARLGSFRSTVKLLLSQAEKQYLNDQALSTTGAGAAKSYADISACQDLAKLDVNEYDTCVIDVTAAGAATVKLAGKGKFAGYSCGSTGATTSTVDTVCKKS